MEYILDVKKWRCGENGRDALGTGLTKMLNEDGFMCCLGQWAKQLSVSDAVLIQSGGPYDVFEQTKNVYDPNMIVKDYDILSEPNEGFKNSPLAIVCMRINDDTATTVPEKIGALKEILFRYGHTLKVINYKENL